MGDPDLRLHTPQAEAAPEAQAALPTIGPLLCPTQTSPPLPCHVPRPPRPPSTALLSSHLPHPPPLTSALPAPGPWGVRGGRGEHSPPASAPSLGFGPCLPVPPGEGEAKVEAGQPRKRTLHGACRLSHISSPVAGPQETRFRGLLAPQAPVEQRPSPPPTWEGMAGSSGSEPGNKHQVLSGIPGERESKLKTAQGTF